MSTFGVDYSDARPGGAWLAANGYKFACRYYGGSSDKDLTLAEARDLISHGVTIVGNYEGFANEMRGGTPAGARAGGIAGAQARAAGQPGGRPIYYSEDESCPVSAYETIYDALMAAQAASGYPAGCYGPYGLLEYLYGRGIVWLWETDASSWNDFRGTYPHALIVQLDRQVYNGGCDVDIAYAVDFGQWPAPVTVATPDPKPSVPTSAPPAPTVTLPEGVYDMFIAQTIGGQGMYIITADGHKVALNAADSPSVPQMLAILQASDPHPVPLSGATLTAIPNR